MNKLILLILCLNFCFASSSLAKEVEIKADFDLMRNFEDVQYDDNHGGGDETFGDLGFGNTGASKKDWSGYNTAEVSGARQGDPADPFVGDSDIDYYSADETINYDLDELLELDEFDPYAPSDKPGVFDQKTPWDADRIRNAKMVNDQKEAKAKEMFGNQPRPGHRVAPIDPPKSTTSKSKSASDDLKVHSVIKETGGNVPLV